MRISPETPICGKCCVSDKSIAYCERQIVENTLNRCVSSFNIFKNGKKVNSIQRYIKEMSGHYIKPLEVSGCS